jgi:hypothetical protein
MQLTQEEKVIDDDIKTVSQIFERVLDIGNYKFKLKQMKGKELFTLVNTFGLSGRAVDVKSVDDAMVEVYRNFNNCYDLAMENILFSTNGGEFYPMVINGVYQFDLAETNVAIMYKLLFFVYEAVILFTQISQQQLETI